MAIDINNINFKMFTNFAATAKQSARAQFESKLVPDGEARTIKAAGGLDFVGNVGRLSKYKTANDSVRRLFRETVAGMFGCEEDIPDSVLKVMKFEDYGKGKPLTARRITAVKNAIETFAKDDNAAAKADGDKAIEKLFNSRSILGEMPQEEINELKNTVREIFDTCTSADAREILRKNIVLIVLRGDDSIRSKEEIKAKADAIKANFRELRTVANGNRQILKAGKLLLNSLAGKSLPPGRIAALTAYATGKDAKLDAIKRLKPSSGIVSITKALIQVAKNIKAAFATNDIKFGSFEGDMSNPQIAFVTEVMLMRLAPAKLRAIQGALTGSNAAQLNYIAGEISMKGLSYIPATPEDINLAVMGNPNEDIPQDLRTGIRDALSFLAIFKMNAVSSLIGEILDEEVPELPDNNEWSEDTLIVVEKVKDLLLEHPQIFHEA